MWRIRVFEERVGELTRGDEVHGLVHLSVGQEAVAVGVCGQLRPDDAVYSGHRAHGHAIAKGAPLGGVMAELMGRDGGLCRGLGGSMHLVDVEHGFLGATGVVGGNVPLALGSALAGRLLGGDQVAVVLLRRRRRPGRHLRRVGQPRDAVGAARDPRLREQRLRGVHAALGAHERRARQRRRRAVRRRARDGRRQRRRCGTRRVRAVPRRGAPRRRADAARVPDAPAARPLRGRSAALPRRRWLPRSGRSSTRSCACSARGVAEGWLEEDAPARLEQEARDEVEEAVRVRAREPVPVAALTAELVYAT